MEKIKCRVCGFEWTPTKEDHYIAEAETRFNTLFNADTKTVFYDAWDCPVCGAQFAVGDRKRTVEETPEGPVGIEVRFGGPGAVSIGNGGSGKPYEDLDARVQDECKGCVYEKHDDVEYPCESCSRCYFDRYVAGGKKDGAE